VIVMTILHKPQCPADRPRPNPVRRDIAGRR
jgi:hypothetical protein